MQRLFGASLAIALATAAVHPAVAADLPEVKVSDSNQVPACATPGRLMAYVRTRNPRVSDRFDSVATEYMRHGEELGIRWDIAFFQMILETGALSYTGDVRANQNNFAGLGAAQRGQHGESFADISSGVKAHLQHLLMYAGEHIDDPIAERTRKVQEWGVLTDWQKSINGPMTFTLVAKQWAPGARGYARDIATIGDGFYDNVCNAPDPQPELVQEARKGREMKPETKAAGLAPAPDATAGAAAAATTAPEKPSGAEIAQRAVEQARKEDPPRTGLGAAGMLGTVAQTAKAAAEPQASKPAAQPAVTQAAVTQPAVTLINPSKSETPKPTAEPKTEAAATPPAVKPDATKPVAKADANAGTAKKGAEIQTASVAGAATQLNVPSSPKTANTSKCKVWTASYGGQRAILIKATGEGMDNYTVLDVNEANEKREVDAYIAAYAKGGQKVATFPNQAQALDKAFELCPEG
jgi:hypothetical protein